MDRVSLARFDTYRGLYKSWFPLIVHGLMAILTIACTAMVYATTPIGEWHDDGLHADEL